MFFDYGMILRNLTKKDTVMLLLRVLNMFLKNFTRTYSFWEFFFFMDPDMYDPDLWPIRSGLRKKTPIRIRTFVGTRIRNTGKTTGLCNCPYFYVKYEYGSHSFFCYSDLIWFRIFAVKKTSTVPVPE